MHSINLLPWRECQKQKQLYRFFILMLSLLVIVITFLVILHHHINKELIKYKRIVNTSIIQMTQIKTSIYKIQIYKQKISKFDEQLKLNNQVLDKQHIILFALNKIVDEKPNQLMLESIAYKNKVFILLGQTMSNDSISAFIKHIKTLSIFNQVNLVEVNAKNQLSSTQQFKLNLSLNLKASIRLQEINYHALSI